MFYFKLIQQNSLRSLNLNGHVGFDTLPDQIVSKAVGDGFTFNILCIGKRLMSIENNNKIID